MRIAVYMIGSLGDTLAAMPALWALRRHFASDSLVLVTDRQTGEKRVGPRELLEGAGLLDGIMEYEADERAPRAWAKKWASYYALFHALRTVGAATLVYLVQGSARMRRLSRDMAFFRLAGIRRVIGVEGLPPATPLQRGRWSRVPSQADQFLARLSASGIPVPPPGRGRADLGLNGPDNARFQAWADRAKPDFARPWVAFAPGSKMPSKRWPEERFGEVGQRLIYEYGVWPLVLGGAEDGPAAARLLQKWGCGSSAAGELDVRAAAVGLRQCRLYVGNDTGTMHLAASAGTHCAAIFSSRDCPGLWDPYGAGHVVLRADPACRGCLGVSCLRNDRACLEAITVDEVIRACRRLLTESGGTSERAC